MTDLLNPAGAQDARPESHLHSSVGHPPADSSPGGMLALIERFALDPNVDPDKLERMMQLQERWERRQAELDFNAAKGRILKKLAGIKIVKNRSVLYDIEKNNPSKGQREAFKYAPLEEIDRHLRPLLAEEDMDLSYSDEPREGGGIVIRGRLKHLPGGHYEDSFMPAPLDTSGGKNNVQGIGSTNSYLRRYVACNIFNIVVLGDDDDDGGGGPISEDEAKEIRDLIIGSGADEKRFLAYMAAASVEAIRHKDYDKAISALKRKEKKSAGAA